jgi:NitT/TauT family transport system permease protein
MLILTMFVILIDAVVSLVEKRLLNWRPETATTQSAQG